MSRRSRKKQDEFFQGIAGLVMIGSLGLGYILTKSLAGAVVTAIIAFGLLIGVMLYIRKLQNDRLKRSRIEEIDKMNGFQFEYYLEQLFNSMGYKSEVTQAAGDYGADLVLKSAKKKIVVQAKRYSKNVGIKAIQEVVGAKAHYNADESWAVTNSYFTEAAINLAESNDVRLINRDKLIELILNMNSNAAPNPEKIISDLKPKKRMCSRCGSEMVLRKSSKGQFYGCSSFPKCRNIEDKQLAGV